MALGPSVVCAKDKVLVFAPVSLNPVLQGLAASYTGLSGTEIVISSASTAQLARQIDAGAPADIFVSADELWMQWVSNRELIQSGSQSSIAKNRLVLAVRRETENWVDWKTMVSDNRFAMSEADSVPAGRYAKQALVYFGLWERAQGRAIFGENARVTLSMLARGDIGAAIVYRSDLELEPNVKSVFTFPADSHREITISAALTVAASVEAAGFLDYLKTNQAQGALTKAGFLPAFPL